MLTAADQKSQNHKNVILLTITSPKCQCDDEQYDFRGFLSATVKIMYLKIQSLHPIYIWSFITKFEYADTTI